MFSIDEVTAAQARLVGDGLATASGDDVTCCYAREDEGVGRRPRQRAVGDLHGAGRQRLGDSDVPAGDLPTVDVCGAGACATGRLPADQGEDATVAGCR